MKKIVGIATVFILIMGIMSMSGCKAKEGAFSFEPGYYLRADRDLTENLSSFVASVAIYADNGFAGTIVDWTFEIYDDEDEFIFEISLDNYESFWFPVVLDPFKTDIEPLESNGLINLFANIHDTVETVPGDMFEERNPHTVVMYCTVRDEKGNEQTLEAQMIIQFYQKDEE